MLCLGTKFGASILRYRCVMKKQKESVIGAVLNPMIFSYKT